MTRHGLGRLCVIGLGVGAVVIGGCPPSSDCDVTLDCGPYQAPPAGPQGGGGQDAGRENGEPCGDTGDCRSQHCVDGVCCDTACDGICEACDVATSEGTCSAVAVGTDPTGDCEGGSCDADGLCAQGTCVWSLGFGSPSEDSANAVATDDAGSVFLGGHFGYFAADTIGFGGEPLESFGGFDAFIAKLDGGGGHAWSHPYGGAGLQSVGDLATDASGAVLATGTFAGTIDFGGNPLSSASEFTEDIFIAKLDGGGAHVWSHGFGDTSNDTASALAIDGDGNVVIVGRFDGTIDFGDVERSGVDDAYVAKFTNGGDIDWSRALTGDAATQDATGVATDASGATIVGGVFRGSFSCGGDTLGSTDDATTDAFLCKLDADGDHLWSYRYGDEQDQGFYAVATADDGSIVAVGRMQGEMGVGRIVLQSMGQNDAMVVKLTPDGAVDWAKRFGDEEYQFAQDVAVDASGDIVVTGRFSGTIDFGGGPLLSEGEADVFIVKFASDGTHLYSHRFGDNTSQQSGSAVAFDPTGALLLAGTYAGAIDFGQGPLPRDSDIDLYVAKFSP